MDGMPVDLWLEWKGTPAAVVIPYVRAREETLLGYRVEFTRRGAGGRSNISQGGEVVLAAGVPTALSRISVQRSAGDACSVRVTLVVTGNEPAVASFDCPPP